MGPRADSERICIANITATAAGIRALIRADPERLERLRADWPEMAARLDEVVEFIDWG